MQFERPASLDEAVQLLARSDGESCALAGGTDLLVQLRGGRAEPARVVDLKQIPELKGIERTAEGFRIGAAVCGAEIAEHAALRAAWPGVVEAAELIGSTQIQGRATLGGNLCNASPAADSVPALIAASARCSVVGPNGRRTVAVQDIAIGPGQTSLERGELVVDFRLPERPSRSSDAYLRITPRSEMDIAVVGVGVSLTLDGSGTCTACRVGLGAVAATALLVPEAAEALIGSSLDEAAMNALAAATSAAAKPIDDIRGSIEYRTRVAGVLARRAATIAAQRARSSS